MRALPLLVVLASTVAHAQPERTASAPAVDPEREPQPEPSSPDQPEPEPEPEPAPGPAEFDPTAADSDGTAPPPDQASGVVHPEPAPLANSLRWIPRALLFIPRWTVWTVAQPVRYGAYAYEKYDLANRIKGLLFNVEGTAGIYPVATFTTDFGFDLGARFVHKDLFGEGERLKLRANFGGRYQQGYGIEVTSGRRLGDRVSASVDVTYERRPNERFFGIGNANEVDTLPAMPLDPAGDAALSSRFRENWFRAIGRLESRITGALSARFSTALALREFANYEEDDPGDPFDDPDDPADGDPNRGIEQRFETSQLVGYHRGVDNVYFEAELFYDSRRPSGRYQPRVFDSTGWYATIHGGRAVGVGGDPTAFWRYGGEIQRLFDLYNGSRVLTLRLLADATSGGDGRTDQTLAFIDLPRLGGTELLRGYPNGRFRDRAVSVATAEYSWELGNFLAAYTFVDVGRAWRGFERIDLDSLHTGFGGGVQLHTNKSFLMRAQVAFSREGNAFFELAFTPAFGRRERAGRW